jgi:hypothetical protein
MTKTSLIKFKNGMYGIRVGDHYVDLESVVWHEGTFVVNVSPLPIMSDRKTVEEIFYKMKKRGDYGIADVRSEQVGALSGELQPGAGPSKPTLH